MPKRPESLETALLALEILRRIPHQRKITAPELHRQLSDSGVQRDLRTIQRQLELLSDHFGVERDERSRPYGYKWPTQARGFSVPSLSEQDSLLLTLAESHLRTLLPSNLMKSMSEFFRQARSNLREKSSAIKEREWLSKVRVVAATQPLLPPPISSKVFEEVSSALYLNHWLEIRYRNASGELKDAEVMPLGLAQQGARLYLVCRYAGYENERSLAVNRMISARALSLTFTRPNDFDLQRYDDEGRFGLGDGKKVHLNFRIKKDAGFHLLESKLSVDQTVIEHDSEYEISATVADTAQLQWWLDGFGRNVRKINRRSVE